ncbi:MAG: bifunctional DNA-formamidopyrimidine glycosylase/DNA-(apurinic or apyrimidinic site) lyase [Pedosphaera sp.]|nr:bifunctional DNA-formamidopyrimidine glycosylase/DNA-(apurinic or apyrimidinic site) lyase [Pedosphaera sp.]
MPELPEVEVLVRHLRPLLKNKAIRSVAVRRARVIAPTRLGTFRRWLRGAKFLGVTRRGKYLLFELRAVGSRESFTLLGHLGMTGRMFLAPKKSPLPKHAAVVLELGRERFVYEDTRYFGRLTLDISAAEKLGPEPFSKGFNPPAFAQALSRSRQAIKVKLLDQSLVAGVGNIYASEALFRARISPALPARKLNTEQVRRLHRAIREALAQAIRFGSTVPLRFEGEKRDGLFYFGRDPGAPDYYSERLLVYDRKDQPCVRCKSPIKRIVQSARSTFFCPRCQPSRG